MTVTKLRWIILIISFLLLVLGGLVGINLGGFLPTFACPYIGGTRGGVCFFWRLQYLLGLGTGMRSRSWESFLFIFLFWSSSSAGHGAGGSARLDFFRICSILSDESFILAISGFRNGSGRV